LDDEHVISICLPVKSSQVFVFFEIWSGSKSVNTLHDFKELFEMAHFQRFEDCQDELLELLIEHGHLKDVKCWKRGIEDAQKA